MPFSLKHFFISVAISTQVASAPLFLVGGISFINALDESAHKVFSSRIQNHILQALHNTLHLNHKQLLKGFLENWSSENLQKNATLLKI